MLNSVELYKLSFSVHKYSVLNLKHIYVKTIYVSFKEYYISSKVSYKKKTSHSNNRHTHLHAVCDYFSRKSV